MLDALGFERVVKVSAFRACCAEPLKRQGDAITKVRVGLHHSLHGRDSGRVASNERFACDAEKRPEVLQVCARGKCQHDGAGCVVDALAEQKLAVGRNLQNFPRGVGFNERGECRVARLKVCNHRGEDRGEVQRLHHVRRGDVGKVNRGKAAHITMPSTVTGWPVGK